MKNVLIIVVSFGAGYFANTETGKKLRNWAVDKVQCQINNIVGKINEVTDQPQPETQTPEPKK